jgi:hypothetical protein
MAVSQPDVCKLADNFTVNIRVVAALERRFIIAWQYDGFGCHPVVGFDHSFIVALQIK